MYRMRPEIPDSLAERIEAIYEKAGYSSKTDLVTDSVRRRVEDLENHFDMGDG